MGRVALWIIPVLLAGCSSRDTRSRELAIQAESQLQSGALDGARASINAAIAERDDVPEFYILKGRVALARDSLDEAFDAYSNASSLAATNMEALQAISQLGISVGRWQEAERAANRVLTIDPGDPNATFTIGLLKLTQHKADEGIERANKILAQDPRDVRGLILKSRALFQQGNTADALRVLDDGSAGSDPPDIILLTYLELHRERSDAAAMLTYFRKLAPLRPRDIPLRLDEANLRYKTGDVAGARILVTALLARPDLSRSSMERIVSLWQQYDVEPVALLRSDRQQAFGTPFSRIETARYYLDIGKAGSALATLGSATSVEAKALRARVELSVGPDARAMTDIAEVLSADVTQCDALIGRANAANRRGATRAAITDAQRAIAECPQNSGGYIQLANAWRASKDWEGESRAYDAALAAKPQDFLIARAYSARAFQAGDKGRAIAVARMITRAAPSATMGWKMLVDACARIAEEQCKPDAERRLEMAASAYVLDPLPGERPRNLLGRLQR
ncbi:tetratricopeptide repeat protein [Sphingomonas sp. M1-B02]|uniref:tetratricopeptide repeat protein n=1 Tax=Sphingomonas sp. M1-B02 TaxID=3114300 RepID=UPI00224037B2|nr:tetratricopeptide repeat protein [Sphingomonas sp. S6-11]UZK67731.1 tetratricopeptide repeat protein [Sphingomonas sp. S6-11]